MSGVIKVNLKAGERIHVNGAVIRVDRRVTLALETETTFVLASHVLAESDATTPLRRHYLAVQALLIEPQRRAELLEIYRASHSLVSAVHGEGAILQGLADVDAAIAAGRPFEALRKLRALIDGDTRAAGAVAPIEPMAKPPAQSTAEIMVPPPIESPRPEPRSPALTGSAGLRALSACRRSRRSRPV